MATISVQKQLYSQTHLHRKVVDISNSLNAAHLQSHLINALYQEATGHQKRQGAISLKLLDGKLTPKLV